MSRRARIHNQGPETAEIKFPHLFDENLKAELGKRLRELRRKSGMSSRLLAEKSGVTANTICMIENGKTSPSISTLYHIAIALNMPLTAFFDSKTNREPAIFIRHDQHKRIDLSHGHLETLDPDNYVEGLQPYIISFDPKSDSGPTPLEYEGKAFIYCLTGQVIFTTPDNEYHLEPGDSLIFPATLQHTWCNPLEESSTVLIVKDSNDERGHPRQHGYPI
jgi:transcriptional regulator with XRE-family HTH domain